MRNTMLLSLLPALAIFIGLILLNNIVVTFVLFYGVVCVLVPLGDWLLHHTPAGAAFSQLGFRHFRRWALPAAGLGILFGGAIIVFFSLLRDKMMDVEMMQAMLDRWKISQSAVIPFLFIMIVANSILEEIYWRGYIFGRLRRVSGPTATVLVSSAFYASYHLITTGSLFSLWQGALLTLSVFGAGLFWGWTRLKTDSIWLPLISHLLADLGIMVVYLEFLA